VIRLISTTPFAIVALEAHLAMVRAALKGAAETTDWTEAGVTTIEVPWSPAAAERIEGLARSSKMFGAMWTVQCGDAAPARPPIYADWTCSCGRWWASRTTETTGGCIACAPEGAWKWTERGVEVKSGTTLGKGVMEELLNRRPSP